ncbi:thermonuclease family protein [Robertmurraya sp. FSL R5-0851]|uniref:thermonuclease family protein n=1 Tax=Robertmurraya sp. FSL R5-0851 TaxID=2921584 RepID=UPI0030F6C9D1
MNVFKKVLCVIILGSLLLGLSGCIPSNNNNNQNSSLLGKEITNPEGLKLISANVTNVVDGDTIDVMINNKEERVRLLLIDTPETKHPSKPVQPYGPEASEFTKKALLGKQVKLEKDISERDRYGRILAYVWLDGKMHNEALIEKGLARVATFPPDIKYVDPFLDLQQQAQINGIGIWSLENYVKENGFTEQNSQVETNIGTSDLSCINKIKGNKNSKIFHLPNGAHYNDVAGKNIVWFCTEEEAQTEGYRKSKN